MDNERILEIATEKMVDRRNNVLPTFTCMTNDDEIIAFARAIAAELDTPCKTCEALARTVVMWIRWGDRDGQTVP